MDRNDKLVGMGALEGTDVPRKGNVDRNVSNREGLRGVAETFPARGTWIEITTRREVNTRRWHDVPRKGNVDRNGTLSPSVIR